MTRFSACLAAILLLMPAPQTAADGGTPPCIPLNETLAICTDIDGMRVSFIDATPTAALGMVALQGAENMSFIWAAYWAVDTSLDEYSREQARAAERDSPGYALQDPVAVTVQGFRGVRYDLLPRSDGSHGLPPQSILFLDTGGGMVIVNGYARAPGVGIKDIHSGAARAARILKTRK